MKIEAWVQMDARWWPNISDGLAKPWTTDAVYMDLRYWQNAERVGFGKRPSRRRLQERWGWSDWATRQALKAETIWTAKTKTSQKPPKDLPKTSQTPTKNESEVPVITTDGLPNSSQTPPTHLPAASPRAVKRSKRTKRTKEVNKELMSIWDTICQLRGGRKLKLTPHRAKLLQGRIDDSSKEDVLAVVEWREISRHPRAVYLRQQGYGIDTLLRAAKYGTYLELVSTGTIPEGDGARDARVAGLMSALFDDDDDNVIPFHNHPQPQGPTFELEADFTEMK